MCGSFVCEYEQVSKGTLYGTLGHTMAHKGTHTQTSLLIQRLPLSLLPSLSSLSHPSPHLVVLLCSSSQIRAAEREVTVMADQLERLQGEVAKLKNELHEATAELERRRGQVRKRKLRGS